MFLLVLLPLIAVAIICAVPHGGAADRWRATRGRVRQAVRYRTRRVKLPDDWWEQFERDLAAYLDPHAVRARQRERG